MANVFTGNPWSLDTVYTTTPAGEIRSGRVRVHHFEFVGYAAATDTVEVQDANGRTIWIGVGRTDLSNVKSAEVGWVKGIKVPTLSAGRLLVYIV